MKKEWDFGVLLSTDRCRAALPANRTGLRKEATGLKLWSQVLTAEMNAQVLKYHCPLLSQTLLFIAFPQEKLPNTLRKSYPRHLIMLPIAGLLFL